MSGIGAALLVGQLVIMDEVCVDKKLEIAEPPHLVADFTLMKVYSSDKKNKVGLYVGLHPSLGLKYRKYRDEGFRKSLRKPMKVYLKDFGLIGIQNSEFGNFFHIYAENESDIRWVSKYVNFCSQIRNK